MNKISIIYSNAYNLKIEGLNSHHPLKSERFNQIFQKVNGLRNVKTSIPLPADNRHLQLIHTDEYLNSLNDQVEVAKCFEFPVNEITPIRAKGIVDFQKAMVGGTIVATEIIKSMNLLAINLGGGLHHAKPDSGEGFCLFNDVAIAVKLLQQDKRFQRVLVVDLDAHQGNGTICCLKGNPDAFLFSMHDKTAYPHPKEIGNLDIELPEDADDEYYLRHLTYELPIVLHKFKPNAVIYVAGADVLETDHLTMVAMTPEGVVKRDKFVIDSCLNRYIPVIMTLSGGYSDMAAETQCLSIKNLWEKF